VAGNFMLFSFYSFLGIVRISIISQTFQVSHIGLSKEPPDGQMDNPKNMVWSKNKDDIKIL